MRHQIISPGKLVCWVFLSLIFIVSCSRKTPNAIYGFELANGYEVIRTSREQVEIAHMHDSEHLGVPPKVVELAWNDRFVLAKQQTLGPRGDFPGDIFQVPIAGKFSYWILDGTQTKPNRYGPMAKAEFQVRVISMGLTNLILKAVETIGDPKDGNQ